MLAKLAPVSAFLCRMPQPDFDLVEATCRSGGEVKMNLWIGCQPDVIFLGRAQVVENDMDLSPLRQF